MLNYDLSTVQVFTGTSESAVACITDRIRLILDEELSQHPCLHQWLEIVGLMPVCVQV